MSNLHDNWLNYLNSQINFYRYKSSTNRNDDEFFWNWYNSLQKSGLLVKLKKVVKFILRFSSEYEWFNKNSELLYSTRRILEDEYSKLQFDLYILLKVVGHKRFFFPRRHFDEFISILKEEEPTFDLSKDYAGFPLKQYTIKINDSSTNDLTIKIVTYKQLILLTNMWRQYFIKRDNLNMYPSKGDIVFDCGSCIGDTAILFAACIGNAGEVHTFDPVPLHNNYTQLQSDLNPLLRNVIHINQLAIGEKEESFSGIKDDISKITPGGNPLNNFEVTTIDNYFNKRKIQKIDYIKMDIEGSEVAALRGASATITKFKPKLAISGYHKAEDLWEIPLLIKKLNPEYKIYFEHHTPITWESVFYAV